MTPELTALALAGLLQGAQFTAFSIAANRQVGPKVAMGTRDHTPALTGKAARLQRAMNNHFEGLVLFTVAVVVVSLGGAGSAFTVFCAWLYLLARTLYVPAYVFGWVPWRSMIWAVGFAASILMILAALIN
ncbi:MAPEG family protein [Qingshengfaniella alkalisoli]|uniref:MAPEG family protein n=1 Tax=Qingshengfaniella alkalisoli TaxID=2599296 RepID=A0A5B8IV82_9RHOB|nr:MAPEG family protein [Qingshengfaniella alkalisoli]QDY68388.1 MAPEG family protein [Qingshengfaniella alkalisoli]